MHKTLGERCCNVKVKYNQVQLKMLFQKDAYYENWRDHKDWKTRTRNIVKALGYIWRP